jgi:hypothetical protein
MEDVYLLPKCATPLLGATDWILSKFHPCLAKTHIHSLGEIFGFMRHSFGGDLRLHVLEQG